MNILNTIHSQLREIKAILRAGGIKDTDTYDKFTTEAVQDALAVFEGEGVFIDFDVNTLSITYTEASIKPLTVSVETFDDDGAIEFKLSTLSFN